MNDRHWEILLRVLNGEKLQERPVGFIIDSPWLPGWYGSTILDYFIDPETWFEANLKAGKTFPEIMLLPGVLGPNTVCALSLLRSEQSWSGQ